MTSRSLYICTRRTCEFPFSSRIAFREKFCPIFDKWALHSDVSRQSEISIQCYLRTEEPKRGSDGIADDMGNDIYLGGVRFMPDFDETHGEDQWYDLAGGQGRIQIAVAFKPSSVCAP